MREKDKKLILIIDDHLTNLKVMIEHLKAHQVEIITARDGKSGLERARFAQPDLILLDVQMPGWDGFDTCRRLKKDEETREIPVIFMTALSDVDDKVRGFKAGGVDYVTKPIHAEEVWARVETHLTIRELQAEMAERIQELDAFAHTVAHDLKNPLARIIGSLELLEYSLGPQLDENMRRVLQISGRGSRQMVSIIDELLLLASMRRDDVSVEPVDMEGVVGQVLERLEDNLLQSGAQVELPERWPIASGYAPWLEEVWINYLSNGIKYGGTPPRLSLGAGVDPGRSGMLRFWVKDNGAGLSTAEQAELFKEFSRAEQHQNSSIAGHGLGLSIVARIVRRLGGEVGVTSAPGEGSCFYFTLPAAPKFVLPKAKMLVKS